MSAAPACGPGNGFLVGNPDHHAITGQPRYQACIQRGKDI